jgi:uncharacterized protein
MRRFVGLIIASFVVLTLFSGQAHALDVPAAPTLETPIVDQTGTLTPEQVKQLATQIATSRKEKSYQIGILIVSSVGNDEYLEGYSLKVSREWGIGEKDKSNGVLLLVAIDDRKLRIEVGRGLEGDLTDVKANRIIRNVITPKFKEGKYYEGISEGINSIQLAVANKPDPAAEKEAAEPVDWSAIITMGMFIVIGTLSWLGAVLGRTKSWWAGGVIGAVAGIVLMFMFGFAVWAIISFVGLILSGLGFDYLVSKNYRQHAARHTDPAWWAGGTWGGGSGWGGGSSGGGFGGGGFSGGGSSGSW